MSFFDSKKDFTISWLIFFMLFWGGCKAKHDNSEPLFSITFFPKEHHKKFHSCFNSIHGKGGSLKEQQQCVDSATTLTIPFDITSDTSIYIFQYDSTNFDTLSITYKSQISRDDESYFIQISHINIIQCSFDSTYVICDDSTGHCKDDIKSISVYM